LWSGTGCRSSAVTCPPRPIDRMEHPQSGHVTAEDLHPVPLHKRGGSGEGYMLCDDCGVLAELPSDITLN